MLKIRSRNKEAQKLVSELVAKLTDAGAFFHPALQIDIKGAEFNFSSRKKLKADDELVTLPLRCMPLLDDFSWSLDARQNLCWAPVEAPLAADYDLHKDIVGLLVRFYNRFGKLADYASLSPVVQFANQRPFVECLLALAHEQPFQAKLNEGIDQLVIHAFWHGRIFSDYLTERLHLIPVMEFFDHSIYVDNFFWDNLQDGQRALHKTYQPAGDTKALFARYEIMDNLHAFVKYGFVDEKTFFVQSQPFSLQLDEGVCLEVGYQSASSNQQHVTDWEPPPSFSNSLMYRARLQFHSARVFMPYLLIPPVHHLPAFDEALAAQLLEIERHTGRAQGALVNADVVHEVKMAALKANEAAYASLAQIAKESQLDNTAPATRLLKKMLRHQRQILNEFKKALG